LYEKGGVDRVTNADLLVLAGATGSAQVIVLQR
jgi:hypothetical protein